MSAPNYIGGPFELSAGLLAQVAVAPLQDHFGLAGLEHAFTASGRSALALALERLELREGTVVVPDFLCTDAIYPVLERRDLRPLPFPIQPGLEQSPEAVLAVASEAASLRAVILTAYFGLVEPAAAGRALANARPGLPVILDSVQDLAGLAHAERRAAWAPWQVYSLHKFLPVPHGGLLVGPGLVDTSGASPEFPAHSALAFSAAALRAKVLQGAVAPAVARDWERAFVDLWAQAEAALPCSSQPLPRLSRLLLRHIDVASALEHRRVNLAFLMERLRGVEQVTPLMSSPAAGAAPLALPVRVEGDRDRLRGVLRQQGMFCPVHWPLPAEALAAAGPFARDLAEQILSLPLDQRYTPDDLERLAAAIEGFSA